MTGGSASMTGPIAPSSLYAAMTIASGGMAVARAPYWLENASTAAASTAS